MTQLSEAPRPVLEVPPVVTPVTTLVDHFWHQVATRTDLPALVSRTSEGWTTATWGEFGLLVRRLAAFLVVDGHGQRTRAAIWALNRPEWHIADAAVLTAGMTPAPVYFSLSAPEATYVLEHSESVIAFVDSASTLERLLSVRGALPELRRIVVFDAVPVDPTGFVVRWTDALAIGERALRSGTAVEVDRRRAAVDGDDVATLVYTSGTTGPPKGVMLTHRNIDAAVRSLTAVIPVTAEDRVVSYLPLAHIAERMSSEFRQYVFGNAVHFCPDVSMLGEVLREVHPTVFVGVPRIWEKFARRITAAVDELPAPRRAVARWAIAVGSRAVDRRQNGHRVTGPDALRLALADRLVLRTIRGQIGLDAAGVLISAAAPIGVDTLHQLHAVGLEVTELYGMSEDCGVSSCNPIGGARLGSVGPPLPDVQVRIADDGEILVQCGAVFSGYLKDTDATAEAIIDGWLHTGDVGHIDGQGFLWITDRKKDLLITAGGKNISPSNIEVMLQENGLIAVAVAIGDRRPYVTALITLDPEAVADFARREGLDGSVTELVTHGRVQEEVARHVKMVNARLAPVEQVKRWEILPGEFAVGRELTPTFKVRRRVVVATYAEAIARNYAP